jgi:hypothetical protein
MAWRFHGLRYPSTDPTAIFEEVSVEAEVSWDAQGSYVSTAFLRLRISSIIFSAPIAVLSMA